MPEAYLVTADSQYSRERTGIRKISIGYHIPGPVQTTDPEPYAILDGWKPQSRPLNLPEVDRHATKQTDGSWLLVIDFEGMPDGSRAVGFCEFDHAAQESGIEMFDEFEALAKKYKPTPPISNSDTEGPQFKAWSYRIDDPANPGKKIKNPLFGTSHFADDNVVLRTTFAYGQFLPWLFENVCKIEKPIVPEGQSELRDVDNNKSWLKRSVRGRWRGNVWEYELEYYLGKWAPDIYNSLTHHLSKMPKITGPDGADQTTFAV